MFRLEEKLARIRAGGYRRQDFVIANANDAEMGPGLQAMGPARERDGSSRRLRSREEFLEATQAVIRQDISDILLLSVSNLELLLKRDAFTRHGRQAGDPRQRHHRIWVLRGATYHIKPSRPFRTASLEARKPSPISASIRSPSTTISTPTSSRSKHSPSSAKTRRRTAFRTSSKCSTRTPRTSTTRRCRATSTTRSFAALAASPRPSGHASQDRIQRPAGARRARLVRSLLVVGVLGGGAGTTRDCFELIHQAEKYGARVALFGRKIRLAESPLDMVRLCARSPTARSRRPKPSTPITTSAEAGLTPHRELDSRQRDHRSAAEARGEDRLMSRRGVVTAGTWCVDLNKTIARWPAENTMNYYLAVDRQNGGSGCNMAIDLRRLDPDVAGRDDGPGRRRRRRTLPARRATRYGIERCELIVLPGATTPFSDCFNSLESGRRTHIYYPGVGAELSPDHFDFTRTEARILHLGLPGAHAKMDGPWRGDATGWAATLKAARARGPQDQLEMVSTTREKVRAFGRSCAPQLDLHDRQRLRDRLRRRHRDARRDDAARRQRSSRAARRARRSAPMQLVVAHFPEGAIAVTRDGARFALGSVAMPATRSPASTAPATLSPPACSMAGTRAGRSREPAARPRLRRRLDARGFHHDGRRDGRRMPRARRALWAAPAARLTARLPWSATTPQPELAAWPLSLPHRLHPPRRDRLQRRRAAAGAARHSPQRQGPRTGERGRPQRSQAHARARSTRLKRPAPSSPRRSTARARRWSSRAPRWVCRRALPVSDD